ncbi:MAG: STAS domain-containing protein [Planctomycetota bacterium]|jgi:anti-anti-sigma factor
MELKIRIRQTKPGIVTMSPIGPIDTETSQTLDKEICRILAQSTKTLVLDMEGVDFITSAGVGTIAKAKTSLNRIGGDLAMINLQPQVKKVFEIIRLLSALNVFASMKELDEYLSKVQRRIIEEDEFQTD